MGKDAPKAGQAPAQPVKPAEPPASGVTQ